VGGLAMKMTKKQNYTHFLTTNVSPYYIGSLRYLSLPRKKKKKAKRFAERTFYYDKKRGVCVFHPMLLSTPVPSKIIDTFKADLPVRSHTSVKFRRFSES